MNDRHERVVEHHHCDASCDTQENKAARIKYMRRGALTNAGLFAVTAASGVATGNLAVLIDSGHEAIDTGLHGGRLAVETRGIDQNTRRFRRARKVAFYITGLFSGLMTGKMIMDAADEGLVGEDKSALVQTVEMGTALAIAGGNIYAHRQMSKIEHHSPASGDSHNHATTDRNASVGFATSMAASVAGVPYVGPVGGIVFGAYTTMHMIAHGRHIQSDPSAEQDHHDH